MISMVVAFGAISHRRVFWLLTAVGVILVAFFALSIGRFDVSPAQVFAVLINHLGIGESTYSLAQQRVVELVRLPRVLLALVAGAGLGVAGASLQSLFRNPLVGPNIIGIAPGAAFGGVLAILFSGAAWLTMTGAFVFGLAAILLVLGFARAGGRTGTLTLVLAGVIVGALFGALVSLIQFLANVESELPTILYWLLGSLATADFNKLAVMVVAFLLGGVPLLGLRFQLNVMALGEDEARALGLKVDLIRWTVLLGSTLIIAASVAVAGIIGWIGLVIPHLARMAVGSDNRSLLPASALLGAIVLVLVDTLCRSLTAAEIPLSVITAIAGAPVFLVLLRRAGSTGWNNA